MNQMFYYIILFFVSFLFSGFCYKKVLSIAKEKNIVDNPDARKLQKEPVPVLGGITVFIGIVVGIFVSLLVVNTQEILPIVCSMCVLLFIGMIDDIVSLSPNIRFLIEFVLAVILIITTGNAIYSLEGVLGINEISLFIVYPLSVVSIVGVINAMNLMDGADGLSSGYCGMAFLGYFVLFAYLNQVEYAVLCLTAFGAILPFFFHNVFGKESKMFLGDGGTLMLGIIISSIALKGICITRKEELGFSFITFSLAILSIPIFDTLRVMMVRISNGKSPFYPDKNHLHHAFIRAGFSHLGTTISEIYLGIISVISWCLLVYYNIPITVQVIVLVCIGILNTCVMYLFLESGKLSKVFVSKHLLTETKWFAKMREIVDKKYN